MSQTLNNCFTEKRRQVLYVQTYMLYLVCMYLHIYIYTHTHFVFVALACLCFCYVFIRDALIHLNYLELSNFCIFPNLPIPEQVKWNRCLSVRDRNRLINHSSSKQTFQILFVQPFSSYSLQYVAEFEMKFRSSKWTMISGTVLANILRFCFISDSNSTWLLQFCALLFTNQMLWGTALTSGKIFHFAISYLNPSEQNSLNFSNLLSAILPRLQKLPDFYCLLAP